MALDKREQRYRERGSRTGREIPKVRGKKDRKRWCGGHEGREHKTKCVSYYDVKRPNVLNEKHRAGYQRWKILLCTECGKELAHYYGRMLDERRPAWVTDAPVSG